MPVDEEYETQVENLYDSIKDNPGSKLSEIGNIMNEPWQGLTQAIHDLESKGYVEKRRENEYYPAQDVDPDLASEDIVEDYGGVKSERGPDYDDICETYIFDKTRNVFKGLLKSGASINAAMKKNASGKNGWGSFYNALDGKSDPF